MFVDTFIRRPILASVCSLVIILAGAVAIPTMPVAQYPEAGAAAGQRHRDLHRRQRAGGRDRGHDAARAGDQRRRGHALHDLVEHQQRRRRTITVTFDVTRDLDVAAVDVQNRVNQALGRCRPKSARSASPCRSSRPASCMAVGVLRREGRVRLALPQQLPRRLRQGRAEARPRRRRRHRSSASASTRCGCGSIPTGWRRAASPPATSSARCASRTSRSRPAASARRRRRRADVPDQRARRRAGCARPPSSTTSSSRAATAARWCG